MGIKRELFCTQWTGDWVFCFLTAHQQVSGIQCLKVTHMASEWNFVIKLLYLSTGKAWTRRGNVCIIYKCMICMKVIWDRKTAQQTETGQPAAQQRHTDTQKDWERTREREKDNSHIKKTMKEGGIIFIQANSDFIDTMRHQQKPHKTGLQITSDKTLISSNTREVLEHLSLQGQPMSSKVIKEFPTTAADKQTTFGELSRGAIY